MSHAASELLTGGPQEGEGDHEPDERGSETRAKDPDICLARSETVAEDDHAPHDEHKGKYECDRGHRTDGSLRALLEQCLILLRHADLSARCVSALNPCPSHYLTD